LVWSYRCFRGDRSGEKAETLSRHEKPSDAHPPQPGSGSRLCLDATSSFVCAASLIFCAGGFLGWVVRVLLHYQ